MKIKKGIPLIDQHDKNGFYGGKFGGSYVAETLKKPIDDLTKLFKNIAAIIEEPCEPPTLVKSETLEESASPNFWSRGNLQAFSFDFSQTFKNSLQNLSLFENKPAYSEPKQTIIAPVRVAKSIINFGLNFFSVKVKASANTSLPSASVFKTSIVLPL